MQLPDIYHDIFNKWCQRTHNLIQAMLNDIEKYSLKVNKNQVIFSLICAIYDFEQANEKQYDFIFKSISDFNIVAKKLHQKEDLPN